MSTQPQSASSSASQRLRIAVLGGGKMGEALLAGLLAGGHEPGDVTVSERYAERAEQLRDTYGIATAEPAAAADGAEIVLLATKPQDLGALLAQIAPVLTSSQLVVSVAAGATAATIETALGDGVPVVRCMPNTPALVGQGMTAIAAGSHATAEHLDRAEQVLTAVGRVVRVPEYQLDAVTALSGSGPAYFFLVVEALIDAGVAIGLPRALAGDLVVQTAVGAATMLRESGEHPVLLREAVSSPGGTTVAGTGELEAHGLRTALAAAVRAAAERSRELGG